MRRVLPLILAAGCVHKTAWEDPIGVARAIDHLRSGEPVALGHPQRRVGLDDVVEASVTDHVPTTQPSAEAPREVRLRIRELIAGCPPIRLFSNGQDSEEDSEEYDDAVPEHAYHDPAALAVQHPNCTLLRAWREPIAVGHYREVRTGLIAEIAVSAALLGLGVCAYACDGKAQTGSKIALGVIGGVVVLGTIAVLYFATHEPT